MTSTPAPSEPHISAVVALLDAALQGPPKAIHAYNGKRPDDDTTCVVIYGAPGQYSGSLGDRFSDFQADFQVTAVGESAPQAQAFADRAAAALLTDTPPTIAGRSVWPLWQTATPQPVRRDDTVQPPLWIATAQYAIASDPE